MRQYNLPQSTYTCLLFPDNLSACMLSSKLLLSFGIFFIIILKNKNIFFHKIFRSYEIGFTSPHPLQIALTVPLLLCLMFFIFSYIFCIFFLLKKNEETVERIGYCLYYQTSRVKIL